MTLGELLTVKKKQSLSHSDAIICANICFYQETILSLVHFLSPFPTKKIISDTGKIFVEIQYIQN